MYFMPARAPEVSGLRSSCDMSSELPGVRLQDQRQRATLYLAVVPQSTLPAWKPYARKRRTHK